MSRGSIATVNLSGNGDSFMATRIIAHAGSLTVEIAFHSAAHTLSTPVYICGSISA